MGQSTDAIVFYGYHFDEDHEDVDHLMALYENQPWDSNALVRIDTHCSGDYPMYYVYVDASRVWASRGYPKLLDVQKIASSWQSSWDLELQEFAIEHGLTAPGTASEYSSTSEVGWWLVSYWG